MTDPPILWRPNPGPQMQFLSTRADEALYGGAAGGGKSAALVAMPLRWVEHPRFRALILRRDTTQLADLWDKAVGLYPRAFPGAKSDATKLTWRFPSGARVWFTHCQYEQDVARFDGQEFQFIGYDELTHFTASMYARVNARLRGPADLPKMSRATTNPGGEGHDWVFQRWGPWLNPDLPERAKPGETLHYVRGEDGAEQYVPKGTPRARSRVFIPARLADNPHVGDEYGQQLDELDAVRRAQLKDGDWLIKPGAGLYFRRAWFKFGQMVPKGARGIRYWDRAATEAKPGTDPDWTVGLRMWEHEGVYYVDDVVRLRGTPQTVEATITATAHADGKAVVVGIEQDPGQAGKFEASYYVRALAGWTVRTCPVSRDKVTRAGPVSSQVEHGNVVLVAQPGARWIDPLLVELEGFPDAVHDDQVDALSGSFAQLHRPRIARGVMPDTGWAGV